MGFIILRKIRLYAVTASTDNFRNWNMVFAEHMENRGKQKIYSLRRAPNVVIQQLSGLL
jgi:hypothetical protein